MSEQHTADREERPVAAGQALPADTSRRAVMLGAGGVGLVAVLAACGSGGTDTAAPASSAPAPASSAAPEQSAAGGGDSAGFAKTADIPEGGGKIFADQKLVVTQPAAGQFKAFSSTCTHQGCTVGDVSGGTINCPCHGSKFSITDGSVKGGPAPRPLPETQIKVDGDAISLA
ncbi:iron-sulfur protein [Microtetraspora sp. NBRC 13810]|uniref:Rieske (2Fe-2S) protein n=1 Tax=Microtetraspora sp. NBRC 13810 TaxID=3030990 RepID=UPI0024A44F8C|nr:Rieske (2Fe-2S) protein [Microtetraspora sp. NBRC 13810]GLW08364.1 iron-sulfur protein [Microtetraspora sp. NBRC 13810]